MQSEERMGEMYGKSNMETYITICKIDSKQEFAVFLSWEPHEQYEKAKR